MPPFLDRILASPRNRLIALQTLGGAAIVAIATAASGVPVGSAASSPSPGASLERFAPSQLTRILGRDVRSDTGAVIGRLVDLLVDGDGRPRAAIIDFGGFLGVGSRKIAIDWKTLRFDAAGEDEAITVDLDRDQLKAAPEYKEPAEAVAVVGLPKAQLGQ